MIGDKKRQFIEVYMGDKDEDLLFAMRSAGFAGTDTYLRAKARKMLNDPMILKAIEVRDEYTASRNSKVATRLERQALWTSLMRNEDEDSHPEYDSSNVIKKVNVSLAMRLKASELLGRSETDFVEKIDLSGKITITDIITDSYKLGNTEEDSIEAIEAQYKLAQGEEVEEVETISAEEGMNHYKESESEDDPSMDTFI